MFIAGIFVHFLLMIFMVNVVGISVEGAKFGFFIGALIMTYGFIKADIQKAGGK